MNTTTNSTFEKINLTAKVETFYADKKAKLEARSITYVEKVLLPKLVGLAEAGTRYDCVLPPEDVDINIVIKALHERAVCSASLAGYGGKISITW